MTSITVSNSSTSVNADYPVLVDVVGAANVPLAKLDIGAAGVSSPVTSANPLPVSLTGNQAVNVAQINGVTTTMGNGVSGTGVQRVTLASDSTGQVTLATGANTIGALTANQTVNVAQINGVAPTMGNGASGTGVQRVTLANDSTGILATVSTVTNLSQLGGQAVAMGTGVRTAGTQRVTVATDDVVPVSISSVPSHAVTNAGTFAVQAAITAASASIASGAIASGALASGSIASGAIVDGASVTIGTKADAKSTATDTTAVTAMQVLKQISASVQAPPSQAVTNAGTFAVQAAVTAASGSIASGAIASGAVASGAVASGAFASGSIASGAVVDGAIVTLGAKTDAKNTATDVTSVSAMSVLKQISASVQAPPSQAVTNAGTFAVQAAGDVANAASDSGNPVKIGGVGKTANPTAVTDGQRVNSLFDKLGKQVVVGAIRDLKGQQQTTITSSTTETTIVTAVASTFLDLYGLVITNTSATVTKVTIKDSTAGTTRFVFEIPATETRGFMLPVDSAVAQATVNTAWTATSGTSVASLEITALYVKNI